MLLFYYFYFSMITIFLSKKRVKKLFKYIYIKQKKEKLNIFKAHITSILLVTFNVYYIKFKYGILCIRELKRRI
jgi:hypothetical protein